MKLTDNYKLKKPDISDSVNIDELNSNMDIIDLALTPRLDSSKILKSDSGKLVDILSFLANRIKSITGKSNWREEPSTTLESAASHINSLAPHKGHATIEDLNALAGVGRSTETVKGVSDAVSNLTVQIKSQLANIVQIQDNITLVSAYWINDTTKGYWHYTITDRDITSSSVVEFTVHLNDLKKARKMINICESFDGAFRFYATEQPIDNISLNIKKIKVGVI